MPDLQNQIEESQAYFQRAFDDERLRSEHLEEQLNDMMELHQHEVTNIKQVSTSPRLLVFISTAVCHTFCLASYLSSCL